MNIPNYSLIISKRLNCDMIGSFEESLAFACCPVLLPTCIGSFVFPSSLSCPFPPYLHSLFLPPFHINIPFFSLNLTSLQNQKKFILSATTPNIQFLVSLTAPLPPFFFSYCFLDGYLRCCLYYPIYNFGCYKFMSYLTVAKQNWLKWMSMAFKTTTTNLR